MNCIISGIRVIRVIRGQILSFGCGRWLFPAIARPPFTPLLTARIIRFSRDTSCTKMRLSLISAEERRMLTLRPDPAILPCIKSREAVEEVSLRFGMAAQRSFALQNCWEQRCFPGGRGCAEPCLVLFQRHLECVLPNGLRPSIAKTMDRLEGRRPLRPHKKGFAISATRP